MMQEDIFTEKERDFLIAELSSLYNLQIETLSHVPPEQILSPEELNTFKRINSERTEVHKSLSPALVMIMKATRLCNLRCKYCHSWKDGKNQRMTFEVLCKSIKDSLADENTRQIEFVWHGGETLVMPELFYKKALWLQNFYKRPNQRISNSLQTNATLLNVGWINFFKQYNFNIGVSIDGPPELNDRQRIYKNGNPTSKVILEKLKLLDNHDFKTGLLLVVDDNTLQYGEKNLLDFLVDIKATSVALLNVIPDSHEHGQFLSFDRYVNFLIRLFDIWYVDYRNKMEIRELSALMKTMEIGSPAICTLAGACLGDYLTIEPEGNISACDKYIGNQEYFFGNILDRNLSEVVTGSGAYKTKKKEIEKETIELYSACEHYSVCNGGCPHDNLLRNSNGHFNCCGLSPLITHIKQKTNLKTI